MGVGLSSGRAGVARVLAGGGLGCAVFSGRHGWFLGVSSAVSASYARAGYLMTADSSRGAQSCGGRGRRVGAGCPRTQRGPASRDRPGPGGSRVAPTAPPPGSGVVGWCSGQLADLPGKRGEFACERDGDDVCWLAAFQAQPLVLVVQASLGAPRDL